MDIFIGLGEDEQHAESDPEREKDLEFPAVALAQLVVGDIDRGARRQQHERVHERQFERIDHLRALRGPDPAAEIEKAVGLRIAGLSAFQKNAQNQATKNMTSEAINRIMPIVRP